MSKFLNDDHSDNTLATRGATVHRGIPKTDYMPSRFGSGYVFRIFGSIQKCFLPNLCRLPEW